MSNTLHMVPVNDMIEHDSDTEDCVCGPTVKLYDDLETGGDAWILTHHSLDGREFYEKTPEQEAIEGGPWMAFKPFKKGNAKGTKKKKGAKKKGVPTSLLNSNSPKTPSRKKAVAKKKRGKKKR